MKDATMVLGSTPTPYVKASLPKRIAKIALKFLSIFFATLIVIVAALCAAMWVLAKGPSPTAQRLFVMTVKETSAMGFLANMYLSDAEIDRIMNPDEDYVDYIEATDPSMITLPSYIPTVSINPSDSSPEEQCEEDIIEDLELHEVIGNGYRGYMLIVRDPTRLFVSTPSNFGGRGLTLAQMVENTGAVAGINAGGFDDPGGSGIGGTPDGLVICDGRVVWGAGSGRLSVVGFDADGLLHVGTMTPSEALNLGLQWAVSFGPTLISNGVPQTQRASSGINPRTAIGQRADGAVLLLVIDGRQIESLGATLGDLIEVFLDFDAVNAANLDGGSSTLMIFDGETINNCAAIAGPRPIPTSFLVRAAIR